MPISIRTLDHSKEKPKPRTVGYKMSLTDTGIQIGEHQLTERQLAEMIHWLQWAQRYHIQIRANRESRK